MTTKEATRKIISKDTLVPISLVLIVASCVWWAASTDSAVKYSTKKNITQDANLTKLTENQIRITTILERMEKRVDQ